MDEETAEIILSLQIEDMNRLLEPLTEIQKATTTSDSQIALIAYRDELEARLHLLHDRRMGRSIAQAVQHDESAVQEARLEENIATTDRDVACRIGGVAHAPNLGPVVNITGDEDDALMARLSVMNISVPHLIDLNPREVCDNESTATSTSRTDMSEAIAERAHDCPNDPNESNSEAGRDYTLPPSAGKEAGEDNEAICGDFQYRTETTEASNATSNPMRYSNGSLSELEVDIIDNGSVGAQESTSVVPNSTCPSWNNDAIIGLRKQCASCDEPVAYFTAVYAPCGHDYCKICINSLFLMATRDESSYPPRCCRQLIPLAAAEVFFTKEFIQHFKDKAVEMTTPNKTYCALPGCSSFIPPNHINDDIAVCPTCDSWTCSICKAQMHQGRDCPQDTALNELLDTAAQAGWQRCYQCKRLVELSIGCNHMTCLCGAEFCYTCAERWKNCECELWEEDRLMNRANQLVNRLPAPPAPAEREAIVNEMRQNLQENDLCIHRGWRRQGGRGHCEFCDEDLPLFIYHCTTCRVTACMRCRRHRA